MPTILLDSTVIFDALNNKRGRPEYLSALLAEGNLLACCPVNITEVYAGLREPESQTTSRFLKSLEFFSVNEDTARLAGLLKRDWMRKGRTLSYSDVTIAAVAIENNLPLLTDNRKDFPMPEIELYPLPGA